LRPWRRVALTATRPVKAHASASRRVGDRPLAEAPVAERADGGELEQEAEAEVGEDVSLTKANGVS
jgi:hypothetical protein